MHMRKWRRSKTKELSVWRALILAFMACAGIVLSGGCSCERKRVRLTRAEVESLQTVEPKRLLSQSGAPFVNGNVLLKAVNAFACARGSFPDELDALVPDFLPSIPSPEWGCNTWQYARDTKFGGFSLTVAYKKDLPFKYQVDQNGESLLRNVDYADIYGP